MRKYVLEIKLHKEITIKKLLDDISNSIAYKEILNNEYVDISKIINISFDCYNFYQILIKNGAIFSSDFLPLCFNTNQKISCFYIMLKATNVFKPAKMYWKTKKIYSVLKKMLNISMTIGSRMFKIKNYNIVKLVCFND